MAAILPPQLGRKIGQLADIRRPTWLTVPLMPPIQFPPIPMTSFVGRDDELMSLSAAVTDGASAGMGKEAAARLVTIAGPGGCGKTRLAARVLELTADRWPDGRGWVDLTATDDPGAVGELVANSLGVLLAADDAIHSLARQLATRQMVICLDNCEHVVAVAAEIAAEILRSCPDVTIVATSREPLNLPGELVWRVPPMSDDDAISLFRARAGAQAATDDAAVRIACHRLEGMPLAVELAAAWSATLSPQEIARGLEDRLRLLVRGPRGVAARHQTLAASIAWSHDLLDDADRTLFRRLGVFRNSFTAAAAQYVCAGDDAAGAVIDGLRRLIEKSLLVADTGREVTRYRMQETVREYAVTRLVESGENDRIRDRHLDAYLELAQTARPLLDTDKDAWREVIGADYENLRAAIEGGLVHAPDRGRRLAAELPWFWQLSQRGNEGLDLLRAAIDTCSGQRSQLQARLLTGLALVADTTAPLGLEYDVAQAATVIAREVGDRRTEGMALVLSGVGKLYDDFQAAWDLAADADAIAVEVSDGFVRDGATALWGIVCHLRDEHDRAVPLLESAVDGLIPRGDRGVAATAVGFQSVSAALTGDLVRAISFAQKGVRLASPLGDYHRVGSAQGVLANVLGLAGQFDEAWAAIEPFVRVVDGVESPPFVPQFAQRVGYLHLWSGESEHAVGWFQRGLSVLGGDHNYLAPGCRVGLAAALHRTGGSGAVEHAQVALRVAKQLGMPSTTADALEVLALLAADRDPERAENLHHEALAIRMDHGLRLGCVDSLQAIADLATHAGSQVEADRIIGACRRARHELGYPSRHPFPTPEPTSEATASEGIAMTLDEAVRYARRSRGSRTRPDTGWDSLTPTEHAVVQLAVEGLSNPAIAERMFISRATVKTHLSHVYAKLGVTNRTELATAARRPTETS
ncbi:LuxR family transcriptional regulator [Kribbella sandramycini]|uniref:LuxR family transcriptional regulator n=1 Tax=Kribbella sandramycini TaxID=60450 RepID=A0A7Y4L5U8_9ACTN|nr:LuxR C-terminal-related transcriptional regulator [Kribbella sandramycini]MBB6565951.1 putative ATPase/DNA-binding CsgD family transcriptional regulator [Kribbella sandramycini]NOL44955.1 LuxR family transcriptional regulator [Kribbella sandramycini]